MKESMVNPYALDALNGKIAKYTSSKTVNGVTFYLAKYNGVCVITIGSGSTTNQWSVGETLVTLEDFGLTGMRFAIPSQANFTYGVTGRMSCGADHSAIDTNVIIPAGTSLRGTIVCAI